MDDKFYISGYPHECSTRDAVATIQRIVPLAEVWRNLGAIKQRIHMANTGKNEAVKEEAAYLKGEMFRLTETIVLDLLTLVGENSLAPKK